MDAVYPGNLESFARCFTATANREVAHWLAEVANIRWHATLEERPLDRWQQERHALQLLPKQSETPPLPVTARSVPFESVQHPLSVYGELLGEAA